LKIRGRVTAASPFAIYDEWKRDETNMIETLTDSQLQVIDKFLDSFEERMLSHQSVDREKVEAHIKSLYKKHHLPEPQIVWCENPFQLLGLPFVLQIIKHSGRHEQTKRWLEMLFTRKEWKSVWKKFDSEREKFKWFLSKRDYALPLDSREITVIDEELRFPFQDHSWMIRRKFERQFAEDTWDQLEERIGRRIGWLGFNLSRIPIQAMEREMRNALRKLRKSLGTAHFRAQFLDEFAERLVAQHQTLRLSGNGSLRSAKHLKTTRILPNLSSETVGRIESFVRSAPDMYLISLLRLVNWQARSNFYPHLIEICRELCGDEAWESEEKHAFNEWLDFDRSAGSIAVLPIETICLICDVPKSIAFDDQRRLHNTTGPALVYPDETELYFWHATPIPAWIVNQPELITVEKIYGEKNIEIRRIMIEQYGESKYLLETGATVVSEDECGILYRKDLDFDDPIVMVKVLNSTLEPDGERRTYFLRVPPEVRSAREAVAWTFGLGADEYRPVFES